MDSNSKVLDDFLNVSFEDGNENESRTEVASPSINSEVIVDVNAEIDELFSVLGKYSPPRKTNYLSKAEISTIEDDDEEDNDDDTRNQNDYKPSVLNDIEELLISLGGNQSAVESVNVEQKSKIVHSHSMPADDDFMAWLDQSSATQKVNMMASSTESFPVNKASDVGSSVLVNSFLDDLFRDSLPLYSSIGSISVNTPTSAPLTSSINFCHATNSRDVSYQHIMEQDCEAQMISIIHANSPDVAKLKSLILEIGFIPDSLRCKIWKILLRGSCSDYDLEADVFSASTALSDHYEFVSRLHEDCSRITDDESDVEIMENLLGLYYKRKNLLGYNGITPYLLAPLVVSSKQVSKTLISSCFNDLTKSFFPLVNLQPDALEISLNTCHFWLRLLVAYHSPNIANYLDRMFPGWEYIDLSERPDDEEFGSLQQPLTVDQLELELGLDQIANPFGWSSAYIDSSRDGFADPSSDANTSRSNKPSKKCFQHKIDTEVSLRLLAGLFAGCLPLDIAVVLYDWALIIEEPFAGLYMFAALLDIYSESLLKMSAADIKAWFKSILSGSSDWFKSFPISNQSSSFPNEACERAQSDPTKLPGWVDVKLEWNSFLSGWIYATEVLRLKTPASFQSALRTMDAWATTKAQLLQPQNPSSSLTLENPASSSNVVFTIGSPMSPYESIGKDDVDGMDDGIFDGRETSRVAPVSNAQSEGAGSSATASGASTSEAGFFKGTNLMAKFRRLSLQFQPDNFGVDNFLFEAGSKSNSKRDWSEDDESLLKQIEGSQHGSRSGNSHRWMQDDFSEGTSMCLWADSSEVIPCMALNSRRSGAPSSIVSYLEKGIESSRRQWVSSSSDNIVRGKDGLCLPLPTELSPDREQPFFFGIDCRSSRERSLGSFPKAYRLDPALLADSDEVTALLETLEPLASSVHLCVFGVGDEFYRWEQSNRVVSSHDKSQKEDYIHEKAKLNAVATFFIKKCFKNVSVLDGGFIAAARYLYNTKYTSGMTEALVDADLPMLFAVLGVKPDVVSVGRASPMAKSSHALSAHSAASGSIGVGSSGVGGLSVTTSSHVGNISASGDVGGTGASLIASTSSFFSSFTAATTSLLSANQTSAPSDNASVSSTAPSSNASSNSVDGIKERNQINDITKKLSVFGSSTLDSWKKSVSAAVSSIAEQYTEAPNPPAAQASASAAASSTTGSVSDRLVHVRGDPASLQLNNGGKASFESQSAFVIDADDDDEEDSSNIDRSPGEYAAIPPPTAATEDSNPRKLHTLSGDTHTVSVKRTDHERAQALILHKLAGLRKGDEILIGREFLPGAILFPSLKYKEVPSPEALSDSSQAAGSGGGETPVVIEKVHRYLVVTKERFMVLDADGGGVGSKAVVKSNHHLTELVKMTFRKKDPELVTLYYIYNGGANRSHQYRVKRRQDFVEILQKNMQKFK